jgi:hypothetical protein
MTANIREYRRELKIINPYPQTTRINRITIINAPVEQERIDNTPLIYSLTARRYQSQNYEKFMIALCGFTGYHAARFWNNNSRQGIILGFAIGHIGKQVICSFIKKNNNHLQQADSGLDSNDIKKIILISSSLILSEVTKYIEGGWGATISKLFSYSSSILIANYVFTKN